MSIKINHPIDCSKVLIVNKYQLKKDYPIIGRGCEGTIFNYQNKYAIKTFDLLRRGYDFEGLERKFKKIEAMTNLNDESYCFPIGILGFGNYKKSGYFMDLVKCDSEEKKTFGYLRRLDNKQQIISLIIEADQAIKRAHEKDIYIGDLKEDTIMITADNHVKFIDTDNYRYKDYNYDLFPFRVQNIRSLYNTDISDKDVDIILFSMMTLSILEGKFSWWTSPAEIRNYIYFLCENKEIKDGLLSIFSDSKDKPYISQILNDINIEESPLLKRYK